MMIGMTQGRLTPSGGVIQQFPNTAWREEFAIAREDGFDYLEWITDREPNPANPLWTGEGLEDARVAMEKAGTPAYSMTYDPLMARPWFEDSDACEEALQEAMTVFQRAAAIGISLVVLPWLEGSSLRDQPERVSRAATIIRRLRNSSPATLRYAIETDATVDEQLTLLGSCGDRVGVCYDTGNRSAFGYDVPAEIRLLGERIVHVHIKDKDAAGKNVILGTGQVPFSAVARACKEVGYAGAYTFETTRGSSERETARQHRAFFATHWNENA